LGLGLVASGCGDDTTSAVTSIPGFDLSAPTGDLAGVPVTDMATATPMVVEVTAGDGLMFSPASVTIPVGGTVRWRNTGTILHTVTSGTGSTGPSPGALFDDLALSGGSTFEFTFTTAGTQPYFCRIHEAMGMKGTVVVTP
jgi:plastocyanin